MNTTTGNLFVVVAGLFSSESFGAITDNKGNTYSQGPAESSEGGVKIIQWYAANATGGTNHTFTATPAVTNDVAIAVLEVHSDSPNAFDVGAGGGESADTTSHSSNATAVTSHPNEIVIGGYCSGDSGPSISAGTGFTIPENGEQELGITLQIAIEYQLVSSRGAQVATFTTSTAVRSACIVGCYYESGVGPAHIARLVGGRSLTVGGVLTGGGIVH